MNHPPCLKPGDECDCGRPATMIVNSEKICQTCRQLQTEFTAFERRKLAGKQVDYSLDGLGMCGLNPRLPEVVREQFEAVIRFDGGTLKVQAHGSYEVAA